MNRDKHMQDSSAITVAVVGHTGHGKSMLIRSLAGSGTVDRTKKKSQDGLSTDCRVTPIKIGVNNVTALIEIPAYEQNLTEILRGLCAVDLVVLVVAADEGLMPQAVALLNVMRWLEIRHGFIVLSRTDLADEELRSLAEEEIRETVEGSFLQGSPIISFSAVTQTGIKEMISCLSTAVKRVPLKSTDRPFRMWIDKAFGKPGIGTIVCGTILSGRVRVDDPLALLPENKITKARSLEVHHLRVDEAITGQRIGINLPRITLDNVVWGMALAAPDAWKTGRYLNAVIRVSSPVVDGQQVTVFIGTATKVAALRLIKAKTITAGESALVQLTLDEEITAARGDRFIVALLNKKTLIGGGAVLELPEYSLEESNADDTIAFLTAMQNNRPDEMIRACLRRYDGRTVGVKEISSITGLSGSTIQRELSAMMKHAEIIRLDNGNYFLKEHYDQCAKNIINAMKDRLEQHPLIPSVNKEEIKAFLSPTPSDKLINQVMAELVFTGKIHQHGSDYTIPDFKGTLSADQQRLARQVIAYAERNGESPFSLGSFFHNTRIRINKKEMLQIIDYLCRQGELIRICFDHFLLPMSLAVIKQRVKKAAENTDYIHLSSSKEILGFGRSKGTLVFEYLDEIGFTVRHGDFRRLNRSTGSVFGPADNFRPQRTG